MVQNQKRRQEGIMGKIDKDQLELFPDIGKVKVKLTNTVRTKVRISKYGKMNSIFIDKLGETVHPLIERIKGYFLNDRNKAYWAGMMDGDASIYRGEPNKLNNWQVCLELKQSAAEPVFEFAELFDSYITEIDTKNKNAEASLRSIISGPRAIIFCYFINEYIYSDERKSRIAKCLKEAGFEDEHINVPRKPINWDYIAGIFDSEGSAEMELRQSGKSKNYKMSFKITNSDQSITEPIREFFKSKNYMFHSDNARKGSMSYKKYHSTPELKKKWDESHLKEVRDVRIDPGKDQIHLCTLYDELIPRIKIGHKIKSMEDTQKYVYLKKRLRGLNG